VGAVLRFWGSTGAYALFGRGFPYGALTVNVLGSLLMGFLFVLFFDRIATNGDLRAAILVGGLGAFTTFSTFSMETLTLIEQDGFLKAGLNIVVSVALCLGAAGLGVFLGRQL